MAEKEHRTEIAELGEFGLIDHLTADFAVRNASTVKGVGDDAAVIDYGGKCTLVTTDLLTEGIHFDLMYVPLKHLGYKSIVVNLSDIYAMNAQPGQVIVSIAISNRFSVEAVTELYAGIYLACERYGIDLVGGDTSASARGLFLSVTAIGEAAGEEIVYRDGARTGDLICVSGNLGSAYLGLQLLEREKRIFLENEQIQPDLEQKEYIVGRQLKPEARKDIIALFRNSGIRPGAMIDISDGLSGDLMHICRQSDKGAVLFEKDIPIHPEAVEQAASFNLHPLTCALNGGEDYELLFTLRPAEAEALPPESDISIIGEILPPEAGITLRRSDGSSTGLQALGWNAFR